jgi:hypothetical protein
MDRNLWNLIEGVSITKESDSWSYSNGDMYTVSANYLFLYNKFLPSSSLGLESIGVIAQVWGSWAPSKVIVFSWQALLGRLPTRANLAYRGVLPNDGVSWCPWCDGEIESENHLLVSCPIAWVVWSNVHRWFGVTSVVPSTMSSMCESFLKVYRIGKNGHKGVLMVWHAVVWALWRARNDKIFNDKEVNVEELFDKIQISSWKWLIAKKISAPCLFYEWCVNPLDCIVR